LSGWSGDGTYHSYPFPGMVVEKEPKKTEVKIEKDPRIKKDKGSRRERDLDRKRAGKKNLRDLYDY
jgi:hypothetical protein